MSTYNYPGPLNGPAPLGDPGRIGSHRRELDLEGLLRLTEGLLEALHAEYPGLVERGEIIRESLEEALGDGGPPNRGRIRSSLELISIGASAGSASLAFTQQLMHAMDL